MKQLFFFLFCSVTVMADDTNLEEVLHRANNHFTGNFFSEALKENPGKSIVVSAYSIMTPLALLSLASVGPSHEELLKAIGLPNDNITKSVFSFADTKLRSIKGVELKAANKVYVARNYELNREFTAVSRDVFNSEVQNIDFSDNMGAAEVINEWVEDQTNHRIKHVIGPESIDQFTRAILVNALYFKGTWVTQFDEAMTYDTDFHVTKNKVVKVSMMHHKEEYYYGESDRLQSKILEMPYVGRETSMMLVLPYKTDGITDLLQKVKDISILDGETDNMFNVKVDVAIPKFKIVTTTDLKHVLQNINVTRLFSPGKAHLNKLVKTYEDLYVSSATQQAFIEVNEEGVEAAAVNGFDIPFFGPLPMPPDYSFYADHPFLFLLKEKDNILFSGIYCA